jgi:hypothetical protein
LSKINSNFLQNSETGRRKAKDLIEGYKSQIKFLNEERERNEAFRLEAERCRKQLDQYKAIQLVLAGSEGEVNRMLHERGAFDGKSRDLAVLIVEMKKKIVDLKRERSLYEQRAQDSGRQCEELRRLVKSAQQELQESRLARAALERDHLAVLAENKDLRAREEELRSLQARLESSSSAEESGSPLEYCPLSEDSVDKNIAQIPSSQQSETDSSSPCLPLKSCGIILGEKRKPLTEMNFNEDGKRLRLGGNLYENFKRQKHRDEKVKVKYRQQA